MAFMYVHGFCVACAAPISYNPDHVPSIRVGGTKQAICPVCFAEWNRIHRTGQGLEPLPLHPNAYEPQEVP